MSFSGGSGIASDPYLIASDSDLEELREFSPTLGVYFKQTAHIDMSMLWEWPGIGTVSEPFEGIYDGGGKTISFLDTTDNADGEALGGLFAAVRGAQLSDITLDQPYCWFENLDTVPGGLLIGLAIDSIIQNCKVLDGQLFHFKTAAGSAGMVGELRGGAVRNCKAAIIIVSGSYPVDLGGFVSKMSYSGNGTPPLIQDSEAQVYVDTSVCPGGGGFVGRLIGPGVIQRCSARGDITPDGVTGDLGGFIGYIGEAEVPLDAEAYILIENCYTAVNIQTGQIGFVWDNLGGFIGVVELPPEYSMCIKNCYSAGVVCEGKGE